MSTAISLRSYCPGDASAFRRLNEAWITKYFVLEETDSIQLNDPERNILAAGGQIYFAVDNESDEIIGCCALVPLSPGIFEVAKMAVSEEHQGKGIGKALLSYVIEEAAALGANRLVLETNSKLPAATYLYESLGFEHVIPDHPSPYARADTFMERRLQSEKHRQQQTISRD